MTTTRDIPDYSCTTTHDGGPICSQDPQYGNLLNRDCDNYCSDAIKWARKESPEPNQRQINDKVMELERESSRETRETRETRAATPGILRAAIWDWYDSGDESVDMSDLDLPEGSALTRTSNVQGRRPRRDTGDFGMRTSPPPVEGGSSLQLRRFSPTLREEIRDFLIDSSLNSSPTAVDAILSALNSPQNQRLPRTQYLPTLRGLPADEVETMITGVTSGQRRSGQTGGYREKRKSKKRKTKKRKSSKKTKKRKTKKRKSKRTKINRKTKRNKRLSGGGFIRRRYSIHKYI